MTIAVGAQAPDFSLRDQNNEIVSLAQFRGEKAVLLVFYPLAFTGTCTGELIALRDDAQHFSSANVQAVTVSVDSQYSHKIFAEREGFEFPLLADFWPHGGVASAYGVFNDKTGFANRGTFLIDKDGTVRFTEEYTAGHARDPQVWVQEVDKLLAG